MGIIRDIHKSPGQYLRITNIRKKRLEVLNKNTSEGSGVSTYTGDGTIKDKFFYGFYPVLSNNGKKLPTTYRYLQELTGERIKQLLGTMFFTETMDEDYYAINDGNDLIIPLFTEMEENETYQEQADNNNQCFVILFQQKTYNNHYIRLFDNLFLSFGDEVNTFDKFDYITQIFIDGEEYRMYALYSENWGYSPVEGDKIVSPLTIKFD